MAHTIAAGAGRRRERDVAQQGGFWNGGDLIRNALAGVRVIDISVNAPGPFTSMMLADLGAEVISIVNPAQAAPAYAGAADDHMLAGRGSSYDALARGKSKRPLNLKSQQGLEAILDSVRQADVLISEMRPGKLDSLGIGWDTLHAVSPRLILCEITGYGRSVPHRARAGHDINYLALSGALSLIRDTHGKPVVPQNLIGDYAAGGTIAVSVILAALIERGRTGLGQRITLSMTDGIRYLMSDIAATTLLAGHPEESWRATLNGGMPTYDTYQTADGGWIAVGALEPKFIATLAEKLAWPQLVDLMARKDGWDDARRGLQDRFATRSREAWTRLFEHCDACVTPVLSLDETRLKGIPSIDEVLA